MFNENDNKFNRSEHGLLQTVLYRNNDDFFDLCETTMNLINRMYETLLTHWAEQHPLINVNGRLSNIETMFKAFHSYSTDLLSEIKQKEFKNIGHDGDKMEILAKMVREKRAEQAKIWEENQRYEEELKRLNQQLEQEQFAANEYLRQLIASKRKRCRLLEEKIKLVPDRKAKTGNSQEYLAWLEADMVDVLNEALHEIAQLRTAIAKGPELFRGQNQYATLNAILTPKPLARLPQRLLTLYVELYKNLLELKVRNIIENQTMPFN